jgi:hypothetical protein
MADGNEEHFRLVQTLSREEWNEWRQTDVLPNLQDFDLSGLDLRGYDLRRAVLAGCTATGTRFDDATLAQADFVSAQMRGASFRGAYMEEALLGQAALAESDFTGADLTSTNFIYADLTAANLTAADLGMARLAQATLDGAILEDACLWETQRADWSIKGVKCERVFWDGEKKTPTTYEPGEFEALHGSFPKVSINYKGEMTLVDVLVLPVFLRMLSDRYPSASFSIRSVGEAPGGAQATIVIRDPGGYPESVLQEHAQAMITALSSALSRDADRVDRLIETNSRLQTFLTEEVTPLLASRIPRNPTMISLENVTIGEGAVVQVAGHDGRITTKQEDVLSERERAEIASFCRELTAALRVSDAEVPPEVKDRIVSGIALAEDEIRKPVPSRKSAREILHTLRNITEGGIGSIWAAAAWTKLGPWLGL